LGTSEYHFHAWGKPGMIHVGAKIFLFLLRIRIGGIMKTQTGTLYGIGVGPGDPELLTIKSARIISEVDVIFAAASTKNDYSIAVNIAGPHIPKGTAVRMLHFPMTKDRDESCKAWKTNAEIIISELEQGRDAAFLTLGDPMTYSTYGYVLKNIQQMAPHIPITTIPGITSYQAAAACINTPLVEGEESLLVVSGVNGGGRLRQNTIKPENVVFMKAYRNVPDINAALNGDSGFTRCIGISNCSLPNQKIYPDTREFNDRIPEYWTLIIAKQSDQHA
jgi:precorrin-2/cobalt-factor-2 C20-methyltransferase